MKFPQDCVSIADKSEYLYAAQEKLRLIHNAFARWYKEGLTQQQYNLLPEKVRNKYKYVSKLTFEDFKRFIAEDFEPRNMKVLDALGQAKDNLHKSSRFNIEIEDIDGD
jgi:hypothetical protein